MVSDILQGNKLHPLIFAEQIINGVPIIWDLDGKQRCTNAYLFSKNGYKVSKNIRRPMITYQAVKRDKKGEAVLDAAAKSSAFRHCTAQYGIRYPPRSSLSIGRS